MTNPFSAVYAADKRRRLLVLAVVLVVAAGALWWLNRPEPALPNAGDCLQLRMRVVDCGSAEARYVVLGRVDNVDEEDARAVGTTCAQWPDVTIDTWRERSGGKGVVICMKDK